MPTIFTLIYFLLIRTGQSVQTSLTALNPLQPIRQWLNTITIQHPGQAHLLCQLIPAQCPFARDIHLFGRLWIHIPPLCKLNPFYEEVISLRFRALCYLADVCDQDIHRYC
ncbi:Mo-dependent nitrogenase C-terminal domain-containing protein [Thermosynechococcaceae cyanobacterium BACA0444]|uniref:Mo-dependent nitrogenase C-terminal domain-containing protein n=1 Tax=Pseudocalidococcus azoricus BACA0444 TaxID=2918990 RepID=A0AAE4FNZ6_9CYAN|nr:Mo-dependent nitrogenase C-terminal domain-containing protein [Pseudocalidococcus azoricus]MDS3859445.1 Mo-dependent nitrogenase C-terminal domain-containing protein [Pseudocalidococcus azoricus BACA0444]